MKRRAAHEPFELARKGSDRNGNLRLGVFDRVALCQDIS